MPSIRMLFLKSWANCAPLFTKHQTTAEKKNKRREEGGDSEYKRPPSSFVYSKTLDISCSAHTNMQRVKSRWRAPLAQKRHAVLRNTSTRRHAASQAHLDNRHAGQTPLAYQFEFDGLCRSLAGLTWNHLRIWTKKRGKAHLFLPSASVILLTCWFFVAY